MKFNARSTWRWPILLALCIFFVSGASDIATPEIDLWLSKDKVAHVLVFGLLATSIIRIPLFQRMGIWGGALAILLTMVYGGFDELRQSFTPGRRVEIADWCADSIGAVLATTVYLSWKSYRALLEYPIRFPRQRR